MSRKRTKPEEIRNSDHYFNRYMAKEAVSHSVAVQGFQHVFC